MAEPVAIALDAMGGDNAPGMVIKGAHLARKRFPRITFLVFGDEARLGPLLAKYPKLARVTTVHHTDHVVRSDDKPSVALRAGRGSSMRLALGRDVALADAGTLADPFV